MQTSFKEMLKLRSPLSIVIVYQFVGILWILLSDSAFVVRNLQEFTLYQEFQSSKGIAYVLVTGALLYLLLVRAQNKILEKQRDLDELFLNDCLALIKTDSKGKILSASENVSHLLGYSNAELKGRLIKEITYHDDREMDAQMFQKIKNDPNGRFHYEKRYKHKDGRPLWMEISGTRLNGAIKKEQYVFTIQNVMPLKENERRYHAELSQKMALMNSTDDLIWSVDKTFKLRAFNRAYSTWMIRMFSKVPKLGETCVDTAQEANIRSLDLSAFYKQVLGGSGQLKFVQNFEFEGKQHALEISFNPIIEKEEITGVSCFARDITSLLETQQRLESAMDELKKGRDFIENALNKLPIGVAVNCISTGERQLINDRFSEIYGWPTSKLSDVESFFNHVYPDPEYRKVMKTRIMQDMESGDPDRMIWRGVEITQANGKKKLVDAKNIPVLEQDLMISTVLDVTERQTHINLIENQNERLNQIAWIQSHELRAPLANVMGLLILLEEFSSENENENLQKLLELMDRATKELDRVIDEIVSRCEELKQNQM